MKCVKYFALVVILMFASTGCVPDLVVKNLDVNWDVSNKKARAEITNIGNKDAGNFLVYFNGDENPVSPNRRPQVPHNVAGLAQGDSVVLESDFAPLAHPDNNNLGNVYKITVIADPKNMVTESNENNNNKEVPIPMPDLVITDIFQDGPYLKVTYKNVGSLVGGDFLIKLTNNNTNDSFGGNPLYRFVVPTPNVLQTTGGYTLGLIGLQQGVSINANVTAEIDWEQRVDESNESNNVFTKDIQIQ
jgi:hypothetical protein